MLRIFVVALGALLVFPLGTFAAEDKPAEKAVDVAKADWEKLAGTWVVAKGEAGGEELPKEFLSAIVLTIDGEKYTVEGIPEGTQKGILRIDAAKEVKEMTIEPKEGPNADKPTSAIYKFEDEKLLICYDLAGGGFPKEFKTEAGQPHLLITYERKKEEKK